MVRRKVAPLLRGASRIDVVISEFGRDVTRKIRTGVGYQEDHLRGPLEQMLQEIATSLGLNVIPIGETDLPDLSVRPDYAIDVAGARVGYVELKRPGYGIPGTWKRPTKHDKKQWGQLQLLPNVLYSDGQSFGRFSFGKLQGKIAQLEPGLERAGDKLRAVDTEFARVMTDFLLWKPERPRTLDELVRMLANLCRLLRDDVAIELVNERQGRAAGRTFTGLVDDWRQVLFPNLKDGEFSDQYAQTVTFALLLARVDGISFQGRSISEIARLLGKKHSLMGKALGVLTDQSEEEHSVALATMIRVISAVDWSYFPQDSYSMLYESFLTKYDPALRKKSGVYYTPAPIVSFMTRFVDDILCKRLDLPLGFAEEDVIVVDPAMGTGSFLAEVINRVATTVSDEEGPGVVTPRLRELSKRLIGFENQAAPYAVAELRIHSLLKKRHRAEVPLKERRFLADTLDDPDIQMLPMGSMYETMKQIREGANFVKRAEPVMVVIGNPPYADKAKGTAPWIENPVNSNSTAPSLSAFRKYGQGRLEYVLSNKYVYFWRWATWKVFDAHADHPPGVVAMICSAGFTTGIGFAGMREYLRRTADEGWIINLSPEGHQPPMNTRVFKGNQQPICIAVFIRRGGSKEDIPAKVHITSVSGTFEEKCEKISQISLESKQWDKCSTGWSDVFARSETRYWQSIPTVDHLFPWSSPGVMPDRTWVYAPSVETLKERWRHLITASSEEKAELLLESEDVNLQRIRPRLTGAPYFDYPLAEETGDCPEPIRVGYRSFDRQWLIPDPRLIARPRAPLWSVSGDSQLFITEQHAHAISSGPAVTFTCMLPDKHHYNNRGGRVHPLYLDSNGSMSNVAPVLLKEMSKHFKSEVSALDIMAYIAAVAGHSGYTKRFAKELRNPGVRVPLTTVSNLWFRAIEIGRDVLWLHTYGERCFDSKKSRPRRSPRMLSDRPKVLVAIPDDEEGMPEVIDYEERTTTLKVGDGRISPVSKSVWEFQVSGLRVVKHWFDYRKRVPAGTNRSDLDWIVATTWTPAMTTELLDLLNVLGRCSEIEPLQAELLDEIIEAPQITVEMLEGAGALASPRSLRPKVDEAPQLWFEEGVTPSER